MFKYIFPLAFLFTVGCGDEFDVVSESELDVESSVSAMRPPYRSPGGSLCSTRDRDFREFRYAERIPYCRRNVSTSTKNRIAARYGISASDRSRNYQIDHYIPLSIGGSNRDSNLWPLTNAEASQKARLEYQLFQSVRDGRMSQRQAISEIRRRYP